MSILKLSQAILFSTLSIISFSQNYSIKGSIIYDDNTPLEFGNAILLKSDSSMLKGAVIVDGKFEFLDISECSTILKIQSMGFKTYFKDLKCVSGEDIDIGNLKIKENAVLDEAVITAFKPAFRREAGKIVFDVEGSGMAQTGTVIDLLRKSPGVQVSGTNDISIYGRGAATIYLDGQQITSNEILQSISSEDVKEIQVIKNPGAEFDAEGQGGVINIITIENNLEGTNGSLTYAIAKSRAMFHYGNARLSYKKGKLNTFITVNNYWGERPGDTYYFRTIEDPAGDVNFDNTINDTRNIKFNGGVRTGLDYQFNEKHNLGVQFKSYFKDLNFRNDNINIMTLGLDTLSELNTTTSNNVKSINNGITLNHRFKIDSLGSFWNTSADYATYNSNGNSAIDEIIQGFSSTNENDKQSLNENNIDIFSFKSDYAKSFKDKKSKLELGGKFYYSTNNSKADFNQLINGEWITINDLTSGYDFFENVSALYGQYNFNGEKFDARIGLRGELTNTDGTSTITSNKVVDTTYANLFPSMFVGYHFTKDLELSLQYNTRFRRPQFQELNPFVDYIDSVSSFVGNPFLIPEYSHNTELALTYLEYASVNFGYRRTNNEMLLIVDRATDGSNAFTVQNQNINYGEQFTFGITLPYQTKMWTTYNGFEYSTNKYVLNDGSGTIVSRPSWNFYLYNELNFNKDFSMTGTFWYASSGLDGIFEFNPIYGLNFTVTKKFFDKALTLNLTGNDILFSYVEQGQSTLEGFEVKYRNRYDTRFYRLSVTYNFGKLKKADYKDKSGNGEESGRIKDL